ncbi:MAG: hypothetical protein LCH51_10760 [Bacteroidetes bacterium]|nr:hypothetical protein [Bacteroidota bacterium]
MKPNTNPKVSQRMENVQALVEKLQEQLRQQTDAAVMLDTVQRLQSLLQQQIRYAPQPAAVPKPASKVAVVMPGNAGTRAMVIQPANTAPAETDHQETTATPQPETAAMPSPDWLQSLMQEIPTLAHQKEIRELNEVMGNTVGASMNDKLKQHSIEVAEVLTREPVRDLKKAIGINDRFVFVNELFRGDEVMYERSIKTINSFHVLQEAEFWMERELKLKLGWDDSKDTVRHFIQLVRRRFASM